MLSNRPRNAPTSCELCGGLSFQVERSPLALQFIEPCNPVPGDTIPVGREWLHEVKLDGYRVQVHKHRSAVSILSRYGHDFTNRFGTIVSELGALPAVSVIIDGAVVLGNATSIPDLGDLPIRQPPAEGIQLRAFDLLALNGRDWRPYHLEKRQARLRFLLGRFACPLVLMSETFDDGQTLMRAVKTHGLKGVVSKRRFGPYRSGDYNGWVKVTTQTWREPKREP